MTIMTKGAAGGRPPNPFAPAPGASPPFLAGREAELASISDGADRAARGSAPVPLAFVGLRGLGKTALLNAVRDRTPGALHVRIEVERGVPLATTVHAAIRGLLRSTESLPKRIGNAIENALRHVPLPSLELPHELGAIALHVPDAEPERDEDLPAGQALSVVNDAIAEAKRHLVVTVDEVQDADTEGLRSLVAAVHKSAASRAPIFLACAGLPETLELFERLRTYVRRWDRFELAFLSRAESVEGIRVPLRAAGVEIADAALDLLVDEAAGYPYFLQKYASAAWNRHAGATVTLADVEASLGPVRAIVERTYYADEFRRLSPRERLFCKVLAELGAGPHEIGRVAAELGVKSAAISSIRGNLIRKGIVFSPSPGAVAFRMPLADRYVRDHASFFFDEAVRRYGSELSG